MSELNKDFQDLLEEFKSINDKISPQINDKLKIAHEAFQAAIDFSNKHGIPFQTQSFITGGRERYIPQSILDGKFLRDDDHENVVKYGIEDITGVSFPRYGDAGWANSSSDC